MLNIQMSLNSHESFIISNFKKDDNLEIGQVSCLLNSILIIVENLNYEKKLSKDEIKDIFEYSSKDGIWNEKRKFQRLNKRLREKKCFCRLSHEGFLDKKELFKQLDELNLPVPIFFDIEIMNEIKIKIEEVTGFTIHIPEDANLINDTLHILLLVGYGNYGKDIYFIDPNYMLPVYDKKDLKSLSKLIIIDTEKFWQFVAKPKQYIKVKCNKKEAKKIKNDLKKYFN